MKPTLLFSAACLLWTTVAFPFNENLPAYHGEHHGEKRPGKGKDDTHWVATWTAMPQLVEQANLPPAPYTGSSVFVDATLRQTLHMSIGGEKMRIQISNRFGGTPLPITAASLALPTGGAAGSGSIDLTTLKPLTFSGSSSVTIPVGQVVYTDPIDFSIKPQSMITVTLFSQAGQSGTNITGHPGSRTTSWMQTGNQVNAFNVTNNNTLHWYFLTAVEVEAPLTTSAWVVLGDSITDGRGSDNNANNRWPDLVLAKMQEHNITNISMCNQAAGGNAVLPQSNGLGPPLIERYQRDLLGTAGVKYAMIFEGVNDIGVASADTTTQTTIGDDVESDFVIIAKAAAAAGIKVFGATITPFGGVGQAYSAPARETERESMNKWILALADGSYKASVDFAKVVANPANSSELNPAFDSGDHLHPNVSGYQAIADAFPLDIFFR
ncbi:SGNH hydrolase-type esterase domain-containing protein [Xylariaceae sp. FL0255]|nr:SGNH hydrolase-type esterase domain-containing protein [Xylariaceae sp. FL0255]